jgi:hypothetical protein
MSRAFITRIGPPQVTSMAPSSTPDTASPGVAESINATSRPSRAKNPSA